MTTTTTPYSWLKHLPQALLQKDERPLMANAPSFPLEALTVKLKEIFALQDLVITPSTAPEWRNPDEFYKGLGADANPLFITLAPTLPHLIWAMSSKDIQRFMAALLAQKNETPALEPQIQNEFYQFISAEVLSTLQQLEFDKNLAPKLDNGALPTEAVLSFDVTITFNKQTFTGRLFLSNEFRHAWKERFATRTLNPSREFLQHVNVTMHIEGGKVEFTQSEWAAVNLGDFVCLDSCSLKDGDGSRVMLTVHGHPLFRGKIKDGNIKILENPLYQEGGLSMAETPEHPANEPKSHADADNDEENLFEDDSWLNDEFDLEDEENSTLEDEEHEAPAKDEHSAIEDHHEDKAPAVKAEEAHAEPKSVAAEKAKTPAPLGSKKPFTPEDLPLSITIEVGRIQMTLAKLMELQPGNLLELNVQPEDGVDLVVNGKRIAKGELLLVGEALGVRILDIG